MNYTEEETQFIKFLDYYQHCYKKAYVIAENKYNLVETMSKFKVISNLFALFV